MTKGSINEATATVGHPDESPGQDSARPAERQSKSTIPAGTAGVRRAGRSQPERRSGVARAARRSRTAQAVSKARGNVTALIRTGFGPNKQAVYTMTQIPADALPHSGIR